MFALGEHAFDITTSSRVFFDSDSSTIRSAGTPTAIERLPERRRLRRRRGSRSVIPPDAITTGPSTLRPLGPLRAGPLECEQPRRFEHAQPGIRSDGGELTSARAEVRAAAAEQDDRLRTARFLD